MTTHAYHMLMKELSNRLHFPDMVPDDNGYLGLAFDEIEVHIQYDDTKQEILLFNYLPEIGKMQELDICRLLLSANQFWIGSRGATFSLSQEDNRPLLADRQSISLLSAESFENWLERFVNTAEYWHIRMKRIEEGGSIQEDSKNTSAIQPKDTSRYMGRGLEMNYL